MQQAHKLTIKRFTDINAWKEGHALVIMLYKLTDSFPVREQFGLTGQLRRAVVSITSNIAEGFSRSSYKEKLRFYDMSLGSTTEVQNQLLIARDVGFLAEGDFTTLADQSVVVHKLVNGLRKGARRTLSTPH